MTGTELDHPLDHAAAPDHAAAVDPAAGTAAAAGTAVDMNALLGGHDILFVTLDTLRYDVAAEAVEQGRTPQLARVLPGGRWERRHTPASFTYAAHQAFFAGFLPTPTVPGRHERLFAAAFPGSETSTGRTWVFEEPDVVTALRGAGYHTLCLGGVGFFNRASALGSVLPDLFDEDHWRREFGVTHPDPLRAQLDQLRASAAALPADRPLFTFLNVAALHQPNRHHLPGATQDSRDSHAAALAYVDTRMPELFALVTGRGRPCFAIVCADHGTAYGEDGHTGHRLGHEVVWTVPYAQFTLRPGEW
ncbi:membrane protein [Catellatospora sp. TT07R-123]|uniref:STM4013/SEN3800 family hydrolase n=1 Tax=Catellatospora sp. TT07R-123 TaxID=2733863 RepID=UPI001B2CC2A2|nr:STM4013/SEN3800 family hydrolase [Catellatospora sp. TT07R-123]GHJ45214.1 membrane protein [Catellatospora sp. TT07R-123]